MVAIVVSTRAEDVKARDEEETLKASTEKGGKIDLSGLFPCVRLADRVVDMIKMHNFEVDYSIRTRTHTEE